MTHSLHKCGCISLQKLIRTCGRQLCIPFYKVFNSEQTDRFVRTLSSGAQRLRGNIRQLRSFQELDEDSKCMCQPQDTPHGQLASALLDLQAEPSCFRAPQTSQSASTPRCTQTAAAMAAQYVARTPYVAYPVNTDLPAGQSADAVLQTARHTLAK